MSLTTTQFAQLSLGMGIFVLVCTLITGIAFLRQWGWRFRLVGITGFSVVLTIGLFGLSLAPIGRTAIAGTTPYTVVYDRLGAEAVIAVAPDLSAEALTATLNQAANNLFSPGRNSQGKTNYLTVRARVIAHPRPGVSQPVYLGKIERSLRLRDDPDMKIELYPNPWQA
jgi:Protein of function (DUF2518)